MIPTLYRKAKQRKPLLSRKQKIWLAICIVLFGVGYCYYNTEENKSARAKRTVDNIIFHNRYTADELYFMSEAFRNLREEYVAFHMLKYAAHEGSVRAEYKLGLQYRRVDNEQAVLWLTKAAEKGHAEAQYFLAGMYERNDYEIANVQEDEIAKKAAKYYLQAAEQGHARAQSRMGDLYRLGIGVEKDLHEAEKWYMRAVEQGIREDYGFAWLYIAAGRYDDALPYVYKVQDRTPAIAHSMLAEIRKGKAEKEKNEPKLEATE